MIFGEAIGVCERDFEHLFAVMYDWVDRIILSDILLEQVLQPVLRGIERSVETYFQSGV